MHYTNSLKSAKQQYIGESFCLYFVHQKFHHLAYLVATTPAVVCTTNQSAAMLSVQCLNRAALERRVVKRIVSLIAIAHPVKTFSARHFQSKRFKTFQPCTGLIRVYEQQRAF